MSGDEKAFAERGVFLPPDYEAERERILQALVWDERKRIIKREAKLGHVLSLEGLRGIVDAYLDERKAGEVLDGFGEIVGYRVMYLNYARALHSAKKRCNSSRLKLGKKAEVIKSFETWRYASLKSEAESIRLRFRGYQLNEEVLDALDKVLIGEG